MLRAPLGHGPRCYAATTTRELPKQKIPELEPLLAAPLTPYRPPALHTIAHVVLVVVVALLLTLLGSIVHAPLFLTFN